MSRAVLRQSFNTNAILGASFLPDDVENPVLTGTVTAASITSGTFSTTCPVGTDNSGTVFYDVREDAGSWIDNGTSRTYNHTGKTQLTAYDIDWRARDPGGLTSSALSLEVTTYRNGATAQYIIDNTAPIDGVQLKGILYDFALTQDPDAWISYRTISGPTPSGGTLTANPDGSFTYVGDFSAVWVVQPEVNGADSGDEITINLYDQVLVSPGSTQVNSGGTGAISQTHELAGADAEQVNQAEAAAITQVHLLAGANSTQANTGLAGALGNITITLGGSNSTQANAGTTGEIEQAHNLAASPTTQVNAGQAGAITQVQILAGANATQTNEAWAAAITQTQILLAESAVQANLGASGAITQIGIDDPLTPAEMRDLYNRVIALQAQLERVDNLTKLIPALL